MKRATLPALENPSRWLAVLFVFVMVVGFSSTIGRVNAATQYGVSNVSMNLLINYGNGTLVWYNQTAVPSSWNFFNVTELVTKGNLGAVFFASFGSHFVYSINGVGCPASNIFCDQAWGFWTLDGICWDLPFVGVDQIPVSQSTTVAWYLTPAANFGGTPPTGSNCLTVNIDVKPGDTQPVVNLRSHGVVPVAILSTSTFDATKVNPLTVRFGKTGTEAAPVHFSLQDVNGDGLLDIVLQFGLQSTGLSLGENQVTLMGRSSDGTPFRGSSAIQLIGS
jgi:hypothetical protein